MKLQIKRRAMLDKCESPAERKIFPTFNTMSIQFKLGFDNQVEVGSQGSNTNVYSTREEYCDANHIWFDGYEGNWVDHTWESEIWRIDFVLYSVDKQLAIEIDGAEWHQDKDFESYRDKELIRYGYEVIHFPASYTINDIHIIKDTILERFGLRLN